MKKCILHSIAAVLACGLMFGTDVAQAQSVGGHHAGTLDPTFGTGGTVRTNFGGVSVTPLTAIEQSNGNIAVVTGLGNGVPGEENFALVRYTSNGTLIGPRPRHSSTMASIARLRSRYSPTAISW